jgi:hypothetical protein
LHAPSGVISLHHEPHPLHAPSGVISLHHESHPLHADLTPP